MGAVQGSRSEQPPVSGNENGESKPGGLHHRLSTASEGTASRGEGGRVGENEELIRQIHHRIKNNLQIILSILQLQIRRLDGTGDPVPLQESANRIQSIALSHEMLFRAPDMGAMPIAAYAAELVSSLVQSFPLRSKVTYQVAAANVMLDLEHVIPFGLILSELVTASLRCAAIAPLEEVQIRIGFAVSAGQKIQFRFSHKGKGADFERVLRDDGRALGWRLMEVLAGQLQGTLHISREGADRAVEVTVETPPMKA